MSNRQRVAIDLFCGAGGLTEGLKLANFEVLGAIDNNLLAVEAFQSNHPEVCIWSRDLSALDPTEVRIELGLSRGQLDLLAGCPPCQGFSSMRTKNGRHAIDDPQNDLIFQFLRFVEDFMPRAVLMENVPGLLRDERLSVLRHRLERLGYLIDVELLDAADFDVPQHRRRLVLLAGLGCRIGFTTSAKSALRRNRTVKDAIFHLDKPGATGDELHDIPERRSDRIMRLIRSIPKDGGSRSDLPASFVLACHRKSNGFKDVYGRMSWNKPAPTITGGCVNPSKGRFLHPEQDRAITLREAATLQGFHASYRFPLTRGKFAAAQLIGNALPPDFAYHQAMNVAVELDR